MPLHSQRNFVAFYPVQLLLHAFIEKYWAVASAWAVDFFEWFLAYASSESPKSLACTYELPLLFSLTVYTSMCM
jgi:hypothetical protein